MARHSWIAGTASLLAAAAVLAQPAASPEPAPDCSKSDTPVARLVCSDQRLPVVIERHVGILAAIRAQLPADAWKQLEHDDASWAQGHARCLSVEDPGRCLGMRYIDRDAELQARHGLVPGDGPIRWDCGKDLAGPLLVTFYETDPPGALIRGNDADGKPQEAFAISQPSASGAHYMADESTTFWAKRDEATVTWFGQALRCKPLPD